MIIRSYTPFSATLPAQKFSIFSSNFFISILQFILKSVSRFFKSSCSLINCRSFSINLWIFLYISITLIFGSNIQIQKCDWNYLINYLTLYRHFRLLSDILINFLLSLVILFHIFDNYNQQHSITLLIDSLPILARNH